MNKDQYPNGKLNESDKGALTVAIATEKGNVVIAFPYPIDWFALPPQDAVNLAEMIIKRAREVATEPLTVRI